jgi:hypothetical protein
MTRRPRVEKSETDRSISSARVLKALVPWGVVTPDVARRWRRQS